jgi:RNA binding exosome subunit
MNQFWNGSMDLIKKEQMKCQLATNHDKIKDDGQMYAHTKQNYAVMAILFSHDTNKQIMRAHVNLYAHRIDAELAMLHTK